MHRNLIPLLEALLPSAIEWVNKMAVAGQASGRSLDSLEIELAKFAQVKDIQKIRICVVDDIPRPDLEALAQLAENLGVIDRSTAGITFGHTVFIKGQFARSHSLLAHEFAHVAQYEQHSGTANFVRTYLSQILQHGYVDAPLEVEARRAENVDQDLAQRWLTSHSSS